MDTPENYYAILGVPLDADSDTLKRAYRQLARRYHPDLAGPDGAVEMKRINRAYAILSDPDKRQQYDTITGGVIDLRQRPGRPRPRPQRFEDTEDLEFSGLNIFSTRGPLRAGTAIHSTLGVISALSSAPTVQGLRIAAGSLDGQGMLWHITNGKAENPVKIAADPSATVESLRELRFSSAGSVLAGWHRLTLHVWDTVSGALLWSYPLARRAVSAHYSLDTTLHITSDGQRLARMALPHLPDDVQAPRSRGVRSTDVLVHNLDTPATRPSDPVICTEEGLENRRFWAIRLRALSHDARTLLTLSCAQVPHEQQQMVIVRRWDLTARKRLSTRPRPQIATAIELGKCEDCAPPYATTPDVRVVAFVSMGHKLRVCDTLAGTYSELPAGTMGSSARMALSPDAQWLAVAREDSEINEGVVDLWSISTGQVVQKFYHPWQISALHFSNAQLIVALTDGTIQVWL